MSGLFDGMRISRSGIRIHRILEEVVGHNIANASNENFTRRNVSLDSLGDGFDGQHVLGQGVSVRQVNRIRDTLLDKQLRGATASSAMFDETVTWLNKIQSVFNEPSDFGINSTLSQFWESWSELGADPHSLAARSNLLTRTENLTTQISLADRNLSQLGQDLDQHMKQLAGEINALTSEIAGLNRDIFQIESSRDLQAHDLRDSRDAAIDALSQLVDITFQEDANGYVQLSIADHPAVIDDQAETLVVKNDPHDASSLKLYWEHGERFSGTNYGRLGSVLAIQDAVISEYRAALDGFANTLIEEVNAIYSNGVGMKPVTLLESRLGVEALGVQDAQTSLNLMPNGETRSIHFSFYDSADNLLRTNGIVIDASDSLSDIASKINNLPGLMASVLSDSTNDDRLSIQLDSAGGQNFLGEVAFSVSKNSGGYDSSGLLDLLGFSQNEKSTNSSGSQPILESRDLTELQTILGEATIGHVRSHALNLAGTFTINAFETTTEESPKTNGHHIQQFTITVESRDTIDSIIDKVNLLTAQHGVTMLFNGVSNQLELRSIARTDANGDLQLAGGSDYLRLSFANSYRYPTEVNDEPPVGHQSFADETGLFGKMQLNTLFSGSDAGSIAIDSRIQGANDLHAGYQMKGGDSSLADALLTLQYEEIAEDGQFTLAESFANLISSIGNDVQQTERLATNERTLLENFHNQRSSISGVNLDEELALMIQYQRSYEANTRMFATFNQLAEELLSIIR